MFSGSVFLSYFWGGYSTYKVFSIQPFFVVVLHTAWEKLNLSPEEITKFSLI